MFVSHVPNCVDAPPVIPETQFSDLEELLSHQWIKGWRKYGFRNVICWDDHDSRSGRFKALLMVDFYVLPFFKRTWWVLGYMTEVPTSLPKWIPPSDYRTCKEIAAWIMRVLRLKHE